MRFTNQENSGETNLDVTPETMLYNTPVIEVINGLKWTPDDFEHFKIIMEKVTTRMSSPEASLLLNTLYDRRYIKAANDSESPIELCFSQVLYRETESCFDYSIYGRLLKDYKTNEIRQCLGMSFTDYMNLTTFEKIQIDKFARDWSAEMAKMLQNEESKSDNKIDKYAKALKNTVPGGTLPGMEDMM